MDLVPRELNERRGYFLGILEDEDKVYLEQPSFDCNWYWGFGYIEIYTPGYREQHTHTHWNHYIVGKNEYYDTEKGCFRLPCEYTYHINDNKDFKFTVLTDKMSWTLAELMSTAYQLRKQAELVKMGGSHITTNPLKDILKDMEQYTKINGELLPLVFNEIDKILNPNHEDSYLDTLKEEYKTKVKH